MGHLEDLHLARRSGLKLPQWITKQSSKCNSNSKAESVPSGAGGPTSKPQASTPDWNELETLGL